jgi:hypothetical protein
MNELGRGIEDLFICGITKLKKSGVGGGRVHRCVGEIEKPADVPPNT